MTIDIPDELQQKWKDKGNNETSDQYGYRIYYREGKYRLYENGSYRFSTNTMDSAKAIAAILLHDKVNEKLK
jgi:hypothetical protein